jgi:predicted TIM-barrel fold metal-dependent hydrolase
MMQYFMRNTQGFEGPKIDKSLWEEHVKNFYVDTCSSAVTPDILKLTYDFFGPDHVLFGTDSPVDHVAEPPDMFVPNSLASIQGMHLNEPAQRKIYAGNILSILP